MLNPFVAGRMVIERHQLAQFNGLQLQFRQLHHGLNWNANYTWSDSLTNLPADNANQGVDFLTLRNTDLDKRPSQFDIRHVVQTFGTYDLPVGRGRMFNIDNKYLNGAIGGWTVGSIFVFATGQPIQLTGGFQTVNTSNSTGAQGVVLAPGVTLAQIQKLFNAPLTRLTGRPAGTTTDIQRLAVDPVWLVRISEPIRPSSFPIEHPEVLVNNSSFATRIRSSGTCPLPRRSESSRARGLDFRQYDQCLEPSALVL